MSKSVACQDCSRTEEECGTLGNKPVDPLQYLSFLGRFKSVALTAPARHVAHSLS